MVNGKKKARSDGGLSSFSSYTREGWPMSKLESGWANHIELTGSTRLAKA
jgi:hypothetical protein